MQYGLLGFENLEFEVGLKETTHVKYLARTKH